MKYLKRICSLVIIAVILISQTAFAADGQPMDMEPSAETSAMDAMPFETTAKAVLLMDTKTQSVICELNADEKMDVSTTAKTMSLLLFMEALESSQLKLEDKITISVEATKTGGVRAFLDHGEEYTVDELLKCVQMISANDACMALAEAVSGTEDAFVELMNQRAKELGMDSTTFVNSTGLTAEGQVSTARDMAIVSCELLKHENYYKWSKSYMDMITHPSGRQSELVNPNRLVKSYTGADGIQTGSSTTAGYCLTGSAKRGELSLVCVVLGAPNTSDRFDAANKLLDYGFANFVNINIARAGETVKKNVPVKGGDASMVNVVAKEDVNILVRKGEEQFIKKETEMAETLEAPVTTEDAIGILVVKNGETEVTRVNLYAQEAVEERTLGNSILKIIRMWLY